ncbi:oxygen-insensitive NADPH nitroreductase [Savagea sp. SN6]|uniref:Oxygen-insensitive NADPH nitroreductase n=1 Tax=Savagea serpentis TaxID=2785297 RepID=A0A8J7G492_9BACL|nr:oxygen-insensitive NADPH nitroreductase [Savagea serpentis]MBF4501107.1 oxygen-insensitive NADPH nitroreductase [Savagea serpentis]
MIDLLTSHTSVRKYTEEAIPLETVYELVRAGQHAASSHFVQSYSIIHVTDEERKQQLGELSKNAFQINGAAVVLLFCSDFHRLEKAAALHGETIDYSYAENTIVGAVDVALCAQNIAIAAESKGYGICYIGGVRNNPDAISDLFELPQGVMPLFAMTIGVPTKRNEVKPRLPLQAILHTNVYNDEKYDELLLQYDETMKQYYAERSSNNKVSTWTEQMTEFLKEPKRTYMKQSLEQQGFKHR